MPSLFERLTRATSGSSSPRHTSRLDRYIKKLPIFSTSTAPKEADLYVAIQQHQKTIEDLELKQERLEERKLDLENRVRERIAAGDRNGAAHVLRRAQLVGNEINKVDAMRLKLETVIFGIESAITDKKTLGALADLSQKHKSVLRQYSPERVNKLLEELRDGCDAQMSVTRMFEEIPDEKLSLELGEFETREFEKRLCQLDPVPTHTPTLCVSFRDTQSLAYTHVPAYEISLLQWSRDITTRSLLNELEDHLTFQNLTPDLVSS
eukprot:Blabericola_migrator_1__189@NODE_1050_length_5592_cov_103_667873_g722_i0_p4_GENE_NODE_1050_length_5592_cov_103_667873_g722_i0NODE_1050_length_5592_cov_103_667873_g722_i0_p4_ORF_typecomplete_len265_score63_69Snf7/PF03357_21/1_4e17PspA_IM30/PF04012_12/0_066Troponin/PF00992_20/0_067AAA_13/PF13166_6/0_069PSDC/PF12588_8/0_23DivIC/PF04977_15/2_6_NODE_1050_length_5592_cov_103_667873_g722_i027883582